MGCTVKTVPGEIRVQPFKSHTISDDVPPIGARAGLYRQIRPNQYRDARLDG